MITDKPIRPELVIDEVKAESSGCVVAYIGLIHEYSQGKPVLSLEFKDPKGTAESKLQEVTAEVREKWQLDNIAIWHRLGELKVGDINLVIAVASAHR